MNRVVLLALLLVACGARAQVDDDDLSPPPPLPPLPTFPDEADAFTPPAPDLDGAEPSAADESEDELMPWDAAVPIWSAAGCLVGGALGPLLPLALALPAAYLVVENPQLVPELMPGLNTPGCASVATVFACAGFGAAAFAPCSALGATAAATTAAYTTDRSLWRPLVGGVPGVLCAVLSPLSCLCFALPGGSVLTVLGLAVGLFGGPAAVVGASVLDAQLVERVGLFLFGGRDDDDDDDDDDGAMAY